MPEVETEETPPLFPDLEARTDAGNDRDAVAPRGATPGAAVTLKQLAAELAERRGVDKKQAEVIAADLVDLIADHLKRGERLRLTGLGVLETKRLAARSGRNPATGETIRIAASTKVTFRAAKELRQAA